MPVVFFGFMSVMLVWLCFAIVWAVALLFWPVTLLIAAVVIWRAKRRTIERWQAAEAPASRSEAPVLARSSDGSHHSAFEEYRQGTLRRLDEESAKFREFLERLRKSRDKKEFEAFMAARRSRQPMIAQGDAAAG